MPVYAYKGANQAGRSAKGTISAESARAARAQMRGQGVFLTEIAESSAGAAPVETKKDKEVPLVEALTALVQQTEHKTLAGVLAQVRDKVNEGSSLADALVSTGRFDNLYVSMVRAGEASGALEAVLARIADYLEDQVRLNGRVLSILTYPLFMLLFAAVVVGVMVTMVLPQITEMLLAGAEHRAARREQLGVRVRR